MKIKSHVTFPYDEESAAKLNDAGVKFEIWDQTPEDGRHITFDSIGTDLYGIIPKDAVVIETPVYTKEEIEKAEWLTFRSQSAKVELINEEKTFSCEELYDGGRLARHRLLSGEPFYVKKTPKHGESQGFFCSNTASQYHLFCTERARAALDDPLLKTEASFDPVLLKNGTQAEDLYYLNIGAVLPEEAIVSDGLNVFVCPECGRVSYEEPMQLKLRRKALPTDGDIVKTQDRFSAGGNLAYPIVIVSQRLRRRLIESKLTRALVFEPVIIEEK